MDSSKVTIQECIDKYEEEGRETVVENKGGRQTVRFVGQEG